jgi:hypothetical protein
VFCERKHGYSRREGRGYRTELLRFPEQRFSVDDRLDARTLARLARIDPELLSPVKHRSAQAQLHLTEIRARAVLVSARTALVNAARGLVKSYGERLRKCGTQQFRRETTSGLSAGLRLPTIALTALAVLTSSNLVPAGCSILKTNSGTDSRRVATRNSQRI